MDLLRISFKHNPKEAKIILKNIFADDQRINKIVKENYQITHIIYFTNISN